MIRLKRSSLRGVSGEAPTIKGVCRALQQAIELEHATVPLYLYALYSLDVKKNAAIASILESVVIEEMLHMTLACNVINALGGTPVIDKPSFIPTYPGPLPGGVESDLIVNLAPFSMDQLKTFLQIEQPEDPIHMRTSATLASAVDGDITIGEFYTAIADALGILGDAAFVHPPRNQVGPELMEQAVVVHDVATAQAAVALIIVQGEGTRLTPEDGVGEVAHYYRFMQIQRGHLLVSAPGQTPQWAYSGAPVHFDSSGVYPLPSNPGVRGYPASSIQSFANDNFNYTYTSLLGVLHGLFNGATEADQMNRAMGLMMSLKGQARAMTAGIPDPSVFTAPSFQYQPLNPALR
jgi:rubrerythrin